MKDMMIITSATYGKADVTKKVQELYSKGEKEILASNKVFGDTHWFHNKILEIHYIKGMKPFTVTCEEHKTVKLP